MKIKRIQKGAAVAVVAACAAFATTVVSAQDSAMQQKVSLTTTALKAREAGDLDAAKAALEELIKLAPEDKNVQTMLSNVNASIEVKVQAQKAAEEAAAAEAKAAEEAAAAQAKAEEEAAAAQAKAENEAAVDAEFMKVSDIKTADDAVLAATHKEKLTILAVYDLIDEAKKAIKAKDWDLASEKISTAEQKLSAYEYSPANEPARNDVKAVKARMAKIRAQLAMKDNDPKAAKAFADEYVANEADVDDAQYLSDKVAAFVANPYKGGLEDVSPTFVANQKRVETLLDKGRRQYLYGDYDGARTTFRKIDTIDPSNVQSKAYQNLINEKLVPARELSYAATRSDMLDEVSKGWDRPRIYTGENTGDSTATTDSVVDAKLRNIIIPNISFPDPGVPLSQAINTLSVLSVDYDKSTDAKKGVNIVLFDGDGAKNINLNLNSISLGQALNWITQQAGYQYDIENDTVVVRKASETSTAALDTLEFPVTQAAVTRMVGIKSGGSAGSDDPFGGGGGSAGGDDQEAAIKAFLTKAGVEFGTGANLAFDGSKLFVTNSRRNLDRVRNILLRYSEVKQVEIEAKFMEVNQGNLQELGFNWKVSGNAGTIFQSSNRSLADSYRSTNAGQTPITITQSVGTSPDPITSVVPELPATINLGSSASDTPMVDATLGILDSYLFDLKVTALQQEQGSDLLCAPKVTVLSGATASITVSQQMRYPESWGDVQSNVGSSSSDSDSSSAGVTITPGTPTDFVAYDVGVVMEVTPNVEEDDTINLTLNPRVTEFEGFLEYGGVAVAISSGTTVTVPSGFIQPVFSIREIRTSLQVFDGATVVMGGLTREDVVTTNDQVPILGDIPFLGRLFQSKGESRQKKNLLIFVTVNRISPGGSVGREQFQNVNAGSVFQNPMIVTPGGSEHRVVGGGDSAAAE